VPDAVFPFPGGKSRFASWILNQVPEHTCFVEVFGGAAGVLVNKDPDTSKVEVYNNRDGDLVHFFQVLREQSEELIEWLETVPYSREIHSKWAHAFYHGYRPSDDVERAGQFFYLRYSQWGSKYSKPVGFGTSKVSSRAKSYSNKRDILLRFGERFADVVIENLDWSEVFEKYDAEDTVFYLDPPYVGKEDYYLIDTIDHGALVDGLGELEGHWICSYSELPDGLDEYHVVGHDENHFMGNGKTESAKSARERLVMNFDPEEAIA
jgi:DNA adenine methylase